MTPISTTEYNRTAAVSYARRWALYRNPRFYDYEEIGGDCTNFASQCIYAGSLIMNYEKTYGWYYINTNNHSPSWTGVEYLYNYLTRASGVGPIGLEVGMAQVVPGDIIQLSHEAGRFTHSLVVVSVGAVPIKSSILVCAHTEDSLNRPLATYEYLKARFIHITGVNKYM